jgi:hypothetical protein
VPILILLAIAGGSAAVYIARRPWRFEKLERGEIGRAAFATNLVSTRRR